jgi:hypothetical protein
LSGQKFAAGNFQHYLNGPTSLTFSRFISLYSMRNYKWVIPLIILTALLLVMVTLFLFERRIDELENQIKEAVPAK